MLDPRASAASAKQMFGKDELTAILRFGAEELFKARARCCLPFSPLACCAGPGDTPDLSIRLIS